MAFDLIRIKNLRNIPAGELHPCPGLNLIEGRNGSGKTSIIEAIYMLGRGRSFRDKRVGAVVSKGEHALELFGKYETPEKSLRIGIRKSRKGTDLRLNGSTLTKLSELVTEIPIQIVTPKSHEILERGPEYRRRLLDWGVFHVEHDYHHFSSRYLRALVQRNAALRKVPEQAAIWNRELSEMASRLDESRAKYVNRLQELFQVEVKHLVGWDFSVELEYKRGWPEGEILREVLEAGTISDAKRGFTQQGPHRAELVVRLDGDLAVRRASRGQQKLIVCAIILAQGRVTEELTKKIPVILVDDLTAELDKKNRSLLVERLRAIGCQVYITTTEVDSFEGYGIDKVFHVEHGVVSELKCIMP